jgi:hypothetical protein
LTTFWWQGAAEVIQLTKKIFPDTKVILLGPYARLATAHAQRFSGADVILTDPWPEITQVCPDFSCCENRPPFAYLSVGNGERSPEDLVDEMESITKQYRITSFAFLEHAITTTHPNLFVQLLELIT